MSEQGPPDKSTRNKGETKQFKVEDILSAENAGGALDAYRRASESARDHSEIISLQTATADKLHQLGDEKGSMDFTILASQTRNTERNVVATRVLTEAMDEFHTDVSRLRDFPEDFKAGAKKLGESMEEFRLTTGKLDNAAQEINESGNKIVAASGQMNTAADKMLRASDN